MVWGAESLEQTIPVNSRKQCEQAGILQKSWFPRMMDHRHDYFRRSHSLSVVYANSGDELCGRKWRCVEVVAAGRFRIFSFKSDFAFKYLLSNRPIPLQSFDLFLLDCDIVKHIVMGDE